MEVRNGGDITADDDLSLEAVAARGLLVTS